MTAAVILPAPTLKPRRAGTAKDRKVLDLP